MYGEKELNTHFIMRYGLTKEFFEAFQELNYMDIELPLVIMRKFHSYIESYVNRNLSDTEYVTQLQKKHHLNDVIDAHKALKRLPNNKISSLSPIKRNMILIPGRMAPFSINHFPHDQIIYLIINNLDQQILDSLNLTSKVKSIHYADYIKKQKIDKNLLIKLRKQVDKILSRYKSHSIFKEIDFKSWLLKNLKYALINIHAFSNLLEKYPIKVIVNTTEINNPGTVLSLLASKYNLPFVYLAEDLNSTHSFIPSRASHYCVWGENYKNWLIEHGIDKTRIIETGNIRFEKVHTHKYMPKKNLLNLLNISSKEVIITFTTQPLPGANKIIINWIRKFYQSNEHEAFTLLIRPHRNDTLNYSRIFSDLPKIKVILDDIPLYDILNLSDFIMTISSTTAIEASMYGKGIIILQPDIPYDYDKNNNEYHSHLVKAQAGPSIHNYQELEKTLNKLIESSDYRETLIGMSNKFLEKTLKEKDSPSVSVSRFIKTLLIKELDNG
ncbi:hypothetical protein [Metabacillus halosaccharovorans]|uniref:hypothetical protein n=1 Tax=Metabacillus halosaccharovorans TaxID=930124 RepID=UPI001C1FF7C7|nr:hypothetical protein [Metabacillus halosaccharovorans]MBU7592272.1 hypothetical protein [Metabacillus halosaccharovorans]